MTNETKHTPGPWTVSSAGSNLAIRKDRGIPVLLAEMTPHLPINGIDQEANARLIAAAPEMLQALILLTEAEDVDLPSRLKGPMDRARAAIATAEGQEAK